MYGIRGRFGGIWTHALYSVKQFKVPMVELYKTNVCLFSKDLIAVLINIIQYAGLPTLEITGLPDEPRF